MTPLGIGVVGCGVAAHDLCRAIDTLPEARLAAAYDVSPAAAAALTTPRGATVHETLDGVLNDPGVELVYVGVPHDLLEPTAIAAVLAGRHVLVEKPAALEPAGIRRLAAAAADRRRVVGVMFELREIGAVRVAREALAGGAIGRVTAIRIRTVIDKPQTYWRTAAGGAAAWRSLLARAGGGVVLMNSIHQLDLVRFVTAQAFVRASGEIATLASVAGVQVEDVAAGALRLSGGAVVSLAAAAHSHGATLEERIEIDGTAGRLDLPDPYGEGSARIRLTESWRSLPSGEWIDLDAPRGDPHAAFLAGTIAAVRGRGRPPADLDDAAAALATVRAIYRSAREGRTVVIEGDGDDPETQDSQYV